MRIQHNIAALNSHRQLGGNNNAVAKNLEKLSSGFRINRAGDDAAGLAISEKMRAQIKGLETATKNANDGISLVQTAEGALTEVHSMLNRMTELATQSANGTYDDPVDRANLQKEVASLKSEINRIADGTNFNGINLLDGTMCKEVAVTSSEVKETAEGKTDAAAVYTISLAGMKPEAGDYTVKLGDYSVKFTLDGTEADEAAIATKLAVAINKAKLSGTNTGAFTAKATIGGAMTLTAEKKAVDDSVLKGAASFSIEDGGLKLQIGDTDASFNKLSVAVGDLHTQGLLSIDDIDISTQEGAAAALSKIKNAINSVSSTRGDLGAIQNRLDHTINNLGVTTENMAAAESRIRDVDMAKEMMEFTKNNILIQASQAMLAQANQLPQGVLQLLG